MDRKGMKANARKAYKRHYWMIVVICLFASVFGVAYSSSTWSVNASSPSATVQEDGTAQSDNVSKVLENLLVGDESQARRQVEHNQEQIVQNDTNAMMGRKRGVFASLLNSFSSGSVILSMADAANSIVHNDGGRRGRTDRRVPGRLPFRMAVRPADIPGGHDAHAA